MGTVDSSAAAVPVIRLQRGFGNFKLEIDYLVLDQIPQTGTPQSVPTNRERERRENENYLLVALVIPKTRTR